MIRQLTVLFFIIISACQKDVEDEIPNASDCRLVRMVHGTHDGMGDDTTFLFEYDASNRMTKITWVSEGFPIPFNLIYDAQGNLIKVQNALDPLFLETIFRYNANGRLAEIQYERFDSTKHVFEYGDDTLPLRCRTFDRYNGVWEEGAVQEYTFQNGDMVKSDTYINGIYKWTDNFDYYETLPSVLGNFPLISINSIPFGYWDPFQFFNRHMPKSMIFDSGSDYYWRYTIDSGNIVQSIGCYTQPPSTDTTQKDTRTFQYECN